MKFEQELTVVGDIDAKGFQSGTIFRASIDENGRGTFAAENRTGPLRQQVAELTPDDAIELASILLLYAVRLRPTQP